MTTMMTVSWEEFSLLGAFLFILALIWTFQASFQKYEYLMSKQDSCLDFSESSCLQKKWLEGFLSLISSTMILIHYFNSSPKTDNFEHSEDDNRKFLLTVWLPILMYGIVVISSEALSPMYKKLVRPFLIVAFLCEFSLVTTHIQRMPVGSDKTMYTPLFLLIYFSTLVVLAEILIPGMEELRFLRCGCTLIRGTWYAQVGFTLCMTGREWIREESVGITVLLVFLWHIILSWIVIRVMQNTIKAVLLDQPWADEDYEDFRDEVSAAKGKRRLAGQKEPLQLTREQLLTMTLSANYLK